MAFKIVSALQPVKRFSTSVYFASMRKDKCVHDDPMVSYKITNRPIKTTAIKRIERADKETCPVHILVDGTRYRIRLRDHFLSVEKPKKGNLQQKDFPPLDKPKGFKGTDKFLQMLEFGMKTMYNSMQTVQLEDKDGKIVTKKAIRADQHIPVCKKVQSFLEKKENECLRGSDIKVGRIVSYITNVMDDFCQEVHFDGCAVKWGQSIEELAIELHRFNRRQIKNCADSTENDRDLIDDSIMATSLGGPGGVSKLDTRAVYLNTLYATDATQLGNHKDDILISDFFHHAEPHFVKWVDKCMKRKEHLPTITLRADSGIFYEEVPLFLHEAGTNTNSEGPLLFALARMLVNNPEPAYGLLTNKTHFKLYSLEIVRDSTRNDYLKFSHYELKYRQGNQNSCSLLQVSNYIKANITLIKLLAGIIQEKAKNLSHIANVHAHSNDNPQLGRSTLSPIRTVDPYRVSYAAAKYSAQCVGMDYYRQVFLPALESFTKRK